MKPKFIKYEELSKRNWEYQSSHPVGQEWGYYPRSHFITNGRGEGFTIHGGTKLKEIFEIINALNKRDYEIAKLKSED